ncbi:TPA: hypothetical protein K8U10_004554 [Escherichia coli]|nr:hypothetical protein [Escherichia coli]HBP4561847.1 hypothetical protein [Escherichia coli]
MRPVFVFFRRVTGSARLTMVDLFCCTGAIARQVLEAGSEVLSRVIASGCEVLPRE